MTRYIRRDKEGKFVGHFANPTPGYNEEPVEDDHPEIVAFREARLAAQAKAAERAKLIDAWVTQLDAEAALAEFSPEEKR